MDEHYANLNLQGPEYRLLPESHPSSYQREKMGTIVSLCCKPNRRQDFFFQEKACLLLETNLYAVKN